MNDTRPAVGLLYNPASPDVIAKAGSLVEYFAVMPDRLWFDFGAQAPNGRRFRRALGALAEAHRLSKGRVLAAHGIGLSLPSAMPLDEDFVDAIATMSHDLGGFRWFSEHLSVFLTPKGSVPNAQAGLGLPVVYDDEAFDIVARKLRRLQARFGCPLLLENGAFFTPVPDMDMSEPAFLNRLHAAGLSATLLDIHNLWVGERNGGVTMAAYLDELDPDAVEEIHLAGGDDFAGFYMDSHSGFTPPEVWEMAFVHAPRFRNLRAITFEFQETYFERMGAAGVIAELERMHELAALCRVNPPARPRIPRPSRPPINGDSRRHAQAETHHAC
jgi:uncharacterized protein